MKNFSLVCLTTENRKDRHRMVKREFKKWNIEPDYFYAIPSIGPHESFNLSMKKLLQNAFKDTIIFEDDVVMVHPREVFETALNDLPEDWDILYLGANIREDKPEKITNNLYRVRDAWTTHAILYRFSSIHKILDNFPHESERMYDNYLGGILKDINAYVVNPMCCWQSSGHSDIWGHQVNYNRVFRDSQRKLK